MSVFMDLQKANLMGARFTSLGRWPGPRPKSAFGVGKMSGTCLDPNFRAETSWKEDGACKPCKHQRLEIESAKNDTQKESQYPVYRILKSGPLLDYNSILFFS
jgi:hypothetical protein